ncbi:hypothetical protein [Cypionkella sp.]|jgi:hypothetical protein|uniref:hypothetical protein n=1 Tax=Cypionkella sp. TaxID=2811411 RepID=UPI002715CE95|nr:hypothetical protein [Cypionkella sp.]MDO8985329.1 hypothetical protein [Cypionkella sp.]MDP1575243.1 hypothetical protein [Cypionkella sp.]MDP2048448.1 hypothetical protein [Cypionkella sp.]
MMKYIGAGVAMALGLATVAAAEADKTETGELGASSITLHLQPFLTEAELATLRVVMTNPDALAIFVPDSSKGFAALAVSPDDGFLPEGAPAASAQAIGGLPDAAAAAKDALAACDKLRKGEAACVLVLEIAPKG